MIPRSRHRWLTVMALSFLLICLAAVSPVPASYASVPAGPAEEKEAARSAAAREEDAQDPFLNFDDAVLYAREQLRRAAGEFYLYYKYSGETMNSSIAGSESSRIMNEAWAHTGEGSEGDYAYQHLYSCNRYTVGYTAGAEEGTWNVTYRISIPSLTDTAKEAEVDARVQELLSTLIVPCMSDYEKFTVLYDWLITNCSYANHRQMYVYSAWGALIKGEAVCHGYSLALYKLANDAGFDCRYEANYWHAWVIVKMGDFYYYCDPTWDTLRHGQFLKNAKDFYDVYHVADSPWNTDEWRARYPIGAVSYNPDTATDGSSTPHHVYQTAASDGVLTHTCIYCGESYTGDHSESHAIQHVQAVSPSCEEEGRIEYWHCLDCDAFFTDSALSDAGMVKEADVKIAPAGHRADHVAARAATAEQDGNTEYWHCTVCGKYWLDAQLGQETNALAVLIPAAGHVTDVTVVLSWRDEYGNPVPEDWLPDAVETDLCGIDEESGVFSCGTVILRAQDGWTAAFSGVPDGLTFTSSELIGGFQAESSYDSESHTLSLTALFPVNVQFDWAFDCTSCTASFFDRNQVKLASLDCEVSRSFQAATCTEGGRITCLATALIGPASYTDREVLKDDEALLPLGHEWDEGVLTAEPGAESRGRITYTCLRCRAVRTEGTGALGEFITEAAGDVEGASFLVENARLLLTEEEREHIQAGGVIRLVLDVESHPDVPAGEKDLILAAIRNQKNGTEENSSIFCLNIELNKQISTRDGVLLYTAPLSGVLGTSLSVEIPVPEELLREADGRTGSFYVVRIHDGASLVLETKYNEAARTVTFITDRFSTYAIVFQDGIQEDAPQERLSEIAEEAVKHDPNLPVSPEGAEAAEKTEGKDAKPVRTETVHYGTALIWEAVLLVLLIALLIILVCGIVILKKKKR